MEIGIFLLEKKKDQGWLFELIFYLLPKIKASEILPTRFSCDKVLFSETHFFQFVLVSRTKRRSQETWNLNPSDVGIVVVLKSSNGILYMEFIQGWSFVH